MASVRALVSTVDGVNPHPNADRLCKLRIGGYETIVAKDKNGSPYNVGDMVIYVPPDALIPPDVAEKWGVTNYLGKNGRVRTVKLRGEVSRGFVVPVEPINGVMPSVGDDVTEHYGIEKYEPPPTQNDRTHYEMEHPDFPRYTHIERYRSFPDVLLPGEEVVVTEKIHGTNSRVGIVTNDGHDTVVCGSHKMQKQRGLGDLYETPLTLEPVVNMLAGLRKTYASAYSIVLYGEIFGQRVQGKMSYGHTDDKIGYCAFDLSIDRDYVQWDSFEQWCAEYDVPVVPVLYRGPFSETVVDEYSDGPTLLGGNHIREGIVIRPVIPRVSAEIGRVILKVIGNSYEVKQYTLSDSH